MRSSFLSAGVRLPLAVLATLSLHAAAAAREKPAKKRRNSRQSLQMNTCNGSLWRKMRRNSRPSQRPEMFLMWHPR